MIPRVSRLGVGFVGSGLYYLHDKRPENAEQDGRPSAEAYMLHDKGAQTSNRLGFVELRNLPVRDPDPDDKTQPDYPDISVKTANIHYVSMPSRCRLSPRWSLPFVM